MPKMYAIQPKNWENGKNHSYCGYSSSIQLVFLVLTVPLTKSLAKISLYSGRSLNPGTVWSLYLDKNIRNWAKTLQYLPIVFINTPFLPYAGAIHTIACFRISVPSGFQKTQNQERDPKNNKVIVSR